MGQIFVGTVIGIENPADERPGADQSGTSRYRFRIDEDFNGIGAKEVDVFSGRGGGDCSYHFKFGQSYFVNPYIDDGRLIATICSETQSIQFAEVLLPELRARRDGKKHASLYGVLRRTQQPWELTSYDDYNRPLPGVTIDIKGASHSFSTRTDAAGVYRFYDLPADTYQFAATLPPNLVLGQTILDDPMPPVTIPENPCLQQDLDALPTGRIRGRVLAPDGTPLKYADVELFRKDRFEPDKRGWWEFQGDERSYFQFNHVAPGTYIIVFHLLNRPDPMIPYQRTFYPSAAKVEAAVPLVLADGQQITDADIHAIGEQTTLELIVKVKWLSTPTPDDVFVSAKTADGRFVHARRDESSGIYQLTLFRNSVYTIYASQDCGVRWEGNTAMPIGARETDEVSFDGSDEPTKEVTLALKDSSCKLYPKPQQ